MVETFSYEKIASGYDNVTGLTNIETISVNGRYFGIVNGLGNWSPGVGQLLGNGVTKDQGWPSTSWQGGWITLEQWLYLYRTILDSQRSGPVTIQIQRYDPARYVICNAILTLPQPPTQQQFRDYYRPFVWRFTRLQVIEEQRMYGAIYLKDGSTAIEDITTTPELLTGWSANGEYSGVTPAYASSTLTVGYGGIYRFAFHIDATGTASQQFKFNVRVNAVEGVYQCEFTTNATPDQISTSMEGYLDLDADDVVTVYVETDDADSGTDLTPVNMQLTLESVALDS